MDDSFFSTNFSFDPFFTVETEPKETPQTMNYWLSSPELIDFHALEYQFQLDDQSTSQSLQQAQDRSSSLQASAFIKYSKRQTETSLSLRNAATGTRRNIHRRVVDMLKEISRSRFPASKEEVMNMSQTSRGFRHMMRERQRREKLSQSYADLYSVLSTRSKADKNSIVRSAAMYLKELKQVKEELCKRNKELKMRIEANKNNNQAAMKDHGTTSIRIRVNETSSTINSMIAALKCLKDMNVKASSIQSDLTGHQLSALISINSQVEGGEVERAVGRALTAAEEENLRWIVPGTIQFYHQFHVEHVL